jgi:hypothetical protein
MNGNFKPLLINQEGAFFIARKNIKVPAPSEDQGRNKPQSSQRPQRKQIEMLERWNVGMFGLNILVSTQYSIILFFLSLCAL